MKVDVDRSQSFVNKGEALPVAPSSSQRIPFQEVSTLKSFKEKIDEKPRCCSGCWQKICGFLYYAGAVVYDTWQALIFALKMTFCPENLTNFYQVSETLYRGGQPTEEGFAQLSEKGIKTIINLREGMPEPEGAQHGFQYENISFAFSNPNDEQTIRFLKLVTNTENQPVFLHCYHGADRTGTFCAIYRLVVQGWSKEEALAEMTEGGFGFHRWHQNLIDYVRSLDVQKIKQQVYC